MEQKLKTDLDRKLDVLLRQALDESFHGVGFAVAVSVDGEMRFRKAYGMKDFENLIPAESVEDFTVGVYSCTKPFTALAWMKYMDDNGLRFDSEALRIHRVLAEYPRVGYCEIRNRLRLDDVDYYKVGLEFVTGQQGQIALGAHHLLLHMTGLQRGIPNQTHVAYSSVSQMFKEWKFFPESLITHPVYDIQYSNFGYEVVATMLERLQANSFHNYLWELAAGLNMTNTTVANHEDVPMDNSFPGYTCHVDVQDTMMQRAAEYDLSSHYASCGLVSDADDLNKFGVVSADMYKQAFLTELNGDEPEMQLPLSIETTKMQHDSFALHGFLEGDVNGRLPGWNIDRELLSNVEEKRKLKLRFHHGGLGFGSRAFVSASFHNIRVDNRRETDCVKARQVNPELFSQGTILRCQRRQPTDEECLTRWELPPKMQLKSLMADWNEYAQVVSKSDWDLMLEALLAFNDNANIYIHLMLTLPPSPSGVHHGRGFYNIRLSQLLAQQRKYKTRMVMRIRRLERKIFRQVIREHHRFCRKDEDALSYREIETLLYNAILYKDCYDKIISQLEEIQVMFNYTADHQARIMAADRNPNTDWAEFPYPAHLSFRSLDRKARSYDIKQPFNVQPSKWPGVKAYIESDQFRPAAPNDGGRFDEIDLGEAGECKCERWDRLVRHYHLPYADDEQVMWSFQLAGSTYHNMVNMEAIATVHEDVATPVFNKPEYSVPESWKHCHESSDDDVSCYDVELERKHVVVSVVANQRCFDVRKLSRSVDDAVAEHYFSRDVSQANPSMLLAPASEQACTSSDQACTSSEQSCAPDEREEPDLLNDSCQCS